MLNIASKKMRVVVLTMALAFPASGCGLIFGWNPVCDDIKDSQDFAECDWATSGLLIALLIAAGIVASDGGGGSGGGHAD